MDNRELGGFKSNPMIRGSTIAGCAKNAAIMAAVIASAGTLIAVIRGPVKPASAPAEHAWLGLFAGAGVFFAAVFVFFFTWNLVRAARAQPVYDILEEETPESELSVQPLYGFVAMEFFWGILNRTFLVLVASDGLYGWKVTGPVTNSNRRYFEPFQEMAADTEFMRDLPAIRKLAALPGGFIYPPSQIASITSDDRSQWGMGGIPHSGHVHVRLASGTTRKLILLGEVIPENVRDRMIASLGTRVASMV